MGLGEAAGTKEAKKNTTGREKRSINEGRKQGPTVSRIKFVLKANFEQVEEKV